MPVVVLPVHWGEYHKECIILKWAVGYLLTSDDVIHI